MKRLNLKSTEILNKMVNMLIEGYVKIDQSNGDYMPVSVEQIFENDRYKVISVAHYYEQNGDLMADPEMCFIYNKSTCDYFPSYFKMDGILGREEESILMEGGIIKGVKIIMQMDHALIANEWLENIKEQQNL